MSILDIVTASQENFYLITDSKEYVVKAQILAGGRGKGIFSNGFQGGVKLTTEYVYMPLNSSFSL